MITRQDSKSGAGSGATTEKESTSGRPSRRRRLREIPILPSILTLGNLFCGFLAMAYTTDALTRLAAADESGAVTRIGQAGYVIFLAMVFDALDGRVARMTGQTSKFGGELDSLADMVTFGVAPAFMTKVLAENFFGLEVPRLALAFCGVYFVCAALRLARYNAEIEADSDTGTPDFQGLPSPGAAGLIAGITVVYSQFRDTWDGAHYLVGALPFLVPVLGLLMFSRLRYPHMMNRMFRDPKPLKYLALLGSIGVVVIVTQSVAVALSGLLLVYVLSGPAVFLWRLVTGRVGKSDLELFD
ncbi:MAG: phosphatidylcholine/phosphatidylserine synthase [Planctomycetota bacterium]